MKHHITGFTLIELMIVIAIVGLLAAIAMPSYLTYAEKSRFTEVVNATSPFKIAVETCFASGKALADCDNESNGIPATPVATGVVNSVTTSNGVITSTGTADVSNHTYILTPTEGAGSALTWTVSGTCVAAAICKAS